MRSWRKGIRRWLKPIGFKHTGSTPAGRIGTYGGMEYVADLKSVAESIRVRLSLGADTPVWWNGIHSSLRNCGLEHESSNLSTGTIRKQQGGKLEWMLIIIIK